MKKHDSSSAGSIIFSATATRLTSKYQGSATGGNEALPTLLLYGEFLLLPLCVSPAKCQSCLKSTQRVPLGLYNSKQTIMRRASQNKMIREQQWGSKCFNHLDHITDY